MELYLVRMTDPSSEEEAFYKIGVSENSDTRFSFGTKRVIDSDLPAEEKLKMLFDRKKFIPDHPYDVEHIHAVIFKYEGDARIREKAILETVKSAQYWPKKDFSGKSECFVCDEEVKNGLVDYMTHEAKLAKENAPNDLRYKLAKMMVERDKIIDDPIELHLAVLDEIKKQQQK